MVTGEVRDLFFNSLERCSAKTDFVPAFYDRLFASSEEVREKFRHIEFDERSKTRLFDMVLHSLKLAADAADGGIESLRHLSQVAETHDRYHHNVEPQHYNEWLRALIATARQFDPEWDEPIEAAWRKILGSVIRHMLNQY
jgi:hemoglobin-like flavoprotein